MKIRTTVIIPTWNGKKLLQKNLVHVLKNITKLDEVLIIENGSQDGTVDYLKELENKEDQLRVIYNPKNLGFVKGCNQGVKRSKGTYVCLLNNDVRPKKDFLEAAIKHFEKEDVFAVSLNEAGDKWSGWAKIYWHKGFFNYKPGGKSKKAHITGWASGGGSVFRKKMWEELGGLDELFAPFYWEDTDLSYRAWKKGWRVLWEPDAVVIHDHESTISTLDRSFVDRVKERNQLLFIWKNITDQQLRKKHFKSVVKRILLGPNYIKVVFSAIKQYLSAKNKLVVKQPGRSDLEILEMFK